MPPCLANFFVFLVETGFHHIGQAGLTSGEPSALVSQSAGTTGMSHHTLFHSKFPCWHSFSLLPPCEEMPPTVIVSFLTNTQLIFVFLVETGFHYTGQAGLELLTLSDPPASASQSAKITGMSYWAQPHVSFFYIYNTGIGFSGELNSR